MYAKHSSRILRVVFDVINTQVFTCYSVLRKWVIASVDMQVSELTGVLASGLYGWSYT